MPPDRATASPEADTLDTRRRVAAATALASRRDRTRPAATAHAHAPVPAAVLPEGVRPHLRQAVLDGGGRLVEPGEARMLVWTDPADAAGLQRTLAEAPGIELVQLLWAGVEAFAALGLFHDGRTWLCGKGVYAEPVAEHALALLLALARDLPHRATARTWEAQSGTSLVGARIAVLGGGGITESLLRLLGPLDADVTVVRRRPDPMPGARRVVAAAETAAAIADVDAVVLALALTPQTRGVVDADALAAMGPRALLVNVARGEHVVTGDLVGALRDGVIRGAGLDVTDPEPLPDGHPLWTEPRCLITPHTANTEAMAVPLVSARVRANVRRLADGEPLLGMVDPLLGY
jgi:phosphoglycerate dehydrogenase-like enzyme